MSDKSTSNTNSFLWILIVLLIASILGSIGIFVWLGARKPRAGVQATSASPRRNTTPDPNQGVNGFAGVSEADVPGRYKIDDDGKIMHIVLNEDHTFINRDGTTYPPYRWDVLADGFTVTFQRNSSTWNVLEGPGIYSRTKSDGTLSRMEKLPDLPPAETMFISDKDAVASLAFTKILEGTNLTLANLEGDGAIVPGEAGGQECHHMMRQRSRMSAFFYVRIEPELKKEPFTNALVMVEYFDSPSRDPRNGWISLQYDGRDGIYTSTAQRVKLNGTLKWTHATFVLDAPTFNGSENDGADFRVCVANPDLSVRAVKLAKNAPVQRFVRAP